MQKPMEGMARKIAATLSLIGTLSLLQGCWFAAGAATGAATAEVMDEEGYEITSPIQKEDEEKD